MPQSSRQSYLEYQREYYRSRRRRKLIEARAKAARRRMRDADLRDREWLEARKAVRS